MLCTLNYHKKVLLLPGWVSFFAVEFSQLSNCHFVLIYFKYAVMLLCLYKKRKLSWSLSNFCPFFSFVYLYNIYLKRMQMKHHSVYLVLMLHVHCLKLKNVIKSKLISKFYYWDILVFFNGFRLNVKNNCILNRYILSIPVCVFLYMIL